MMPSTPHAPLTILIRILNKRAQLIETQSYHGLTRQSSTQQCVDTFVEEGFRWCGVDDVGERLHQFLCETGLFGDEGTELCGAWTCVRRA